MLSSYVDLSQPTLWLSAASIAFNPTFWNIAARQEYHNKTITKLFGGNPRHGCYALAAVIFSLGIVRDVIYKAALDAQPTHAALATPAVTYTAYALLGAGNVLVVSSMWALGVTGTYLGDYFGILLPAPVTAFPFCMVSAPMYVGSSLSFVGFALLLARPAGLLLSVLVYAAYAVALCYEDPFTAEIYAKRDRDRAAKAAAEPGREKSL